MNLIETTKLCKRYGNAMRVKHLDLHVPEGAIYGFLGPNGAGKSTTLKMILGLVHPTSGSIAIFGQPVTDRNRLELLRDIGSLIESPAYYGHLTAEENLQIIQQLRKLPKQNIQEVLSIVRLDQQKNKKVCQFSLGMKQRLGLATALISYPKLLILDEPTNGLDPAGIQEMRELILSLPHAYGMTVLVSSHLLSEIDQLATHVGIISEGSLVYQDTLRELHSRSEHHLALRTTDNMAAYTCLSNSGIQSQIKDGWLILPPLDDRTTAMITHTLQDKQIDLLRLEERQKSLEDIFLELTGGTVSL